MGLNEQKCYTLSCDRCGSLNDAGDFVPHYGSEADARAWLDDYYWQYDEEAKHYLCPECPILRLPSYWEKEMGVKIRSRDGWKGQDAKPWEEPISEAEFEQRAMASSAIWPVDRYVTPKKEATS